MNKQSVDKLSILVMGLLEEFNLHQTDMAQYMNITRQTTSRIVKRVNKMSHSQAVDFLLFIAPYVAGRGDDRVIRLVRDIEPLVKRPIKSLSQINMEYFKENPDETDWDKAKEVIEERYKNQDPNPKPRHIESVEYIEINGNKIPKLLLEIAMEK